MENTDNDLNRLLLNLSNEDYCYLTTKGRVSGRLHEIEIWFGVHGNTLYLLSGAGVNVAGITPQNKLSRSPFVAESDGSSSKSITVSPSGHV